MSTIEMDELRTCFDKKCEELEKAQAYAAEMRSALYRCTERLDVHHHRFTLDIIQKALSNDHGKGWLSPEKVAALQERCRSAEQAGFEMAEKVDELKAENQLMRKALELSANHWDGYAAHIAKETLAKLK